MYQITLLLAFVALSGLTAVEGLHLQQSSDQAQLARFFKLPNQTSEQLANKTEQDEGTRWAVLIAGSAGYENYRHQADICHAYQLLKNGGLKDENIIVFMYDDIAYNDDNKHPGKIFNRPGGPDVYHGVPKDYTGKNATAENLYAAILGNRTAIKSGSGKVVDSKPNDYIFIYYADHGGSGAIGMPVDAYVYADDLNKVLKKKHASGNYKQLVFYLEACESGAMFEGLLGKGLNIYAITAANSEESSWAYYCPGDPDVDPEKYNSCLGDLFSISWMEDVDAHERDMETLEKDYETVKKETANPPIAQYEGSHVIQFGDINLSKDHIDLFMGEYAGNATSVETKIKKNIRAVNSRPYSQHDADLLYFHHKVRTANGSEEEKKAKRELDELLEFRQHIDTSMSLIGSHLVGVENVHRLRSARRSAGKPVVDDWDCLKSMVRAYETHCGSLSQYGQRHMRSLANLCNAGLNARQMAEASMKVCTSVPKSRWTSLTKGLSA